MRVLERSQCKRPKKLLPEPRSARPEQDRRSLVHASSVRSSKRPGPVKEGTVVQVAQFGAGGERVVGEARPVHTESAGRPWKACGFAVTKKKGAWIS